MGSPACRELDGVLGLTEALINLRDTRGGGNVQHQVFPLLRQSIYSRRASYEDTNDAERLAVLNASRINRCAARGSGSSTVVHNARRLVFQLAEVAILLALFQGVRDRIGRLYSALG